MSTIQRQNVFLLFMKYDKSKGSLNAYIQPATAINRGCNHFPKWESIQYPGKEFDEPTEFHDYYEGIGPLGEPCLIFDNKKAAVKKAFEDIRAMKKCISKMDLYDIIKLDIFNNDDFPRIHFIVNKESQLLDDNNVIDILAEKTENQ